MSRVIPTYSFKYSFFVFFALGLLVQPMGRGPDLTQEQKLMATLAYYKVSPNSKKHKHFLITERKIFNYLKPYMKEMSHERVHHLSQHVLECAHKFRLNPGLILAVIFVESRFHPWAVSSQGALGLMQIMPETGQWLTQVAGIPWRGPFMLFDPELNITLGSRYLSFLQKRYGGNMQAVLAAYNEGPAKVEQRGLGNMSRAGFDYYRRVKTELLSVASVL